MDTPKTQWYLPMICQVIPIFHSRTSPSCSQLGRGPAEGPNWHLKLRTQRRDLQMISFGGHGIHLKTRSTSLIGDPKNHHPICHLTIFYGRYNYSSKVLALQGTCPPVKALELSGRRDPRARSNLPLCAFFAFLCSERFVLAFNTIAGSALSL